MNDATEGELHDLADRLVRLLKASTPAIAIRAHRRAESLATVISHIAQPRRPERGRHLKAVR